MTDAIRDATLKVLVRAALTLMAPDVFAAMMAATDVPDGSLELDELAGERADVLRRQNRFVV